MTARNDSVIVAIALLAMLAGAFATGPELKTFEALTNPMQLRPGEVSNSYHELNVPVGPIAVYSFVAEVVKADTDGNIVPALLSEVYLHHHVVSGRRPDGEAGGNHSPMKPREISHHFIGFGAGTESRLTPQNFSHPYAFVTEEGQDAWIANVHIINTGPLSESQAHRCLECPCTSRNKFDFAAGTINNQTFEAGSCNGQLQSEGNTRCSLETYHGGLWCCEDNDLCLEAAELPLEMPPTTFFLRYTVQYSDVLPDVRPLYIAGCCDASGDLEQAGAVEYDVPECDTEATPGCVHSLATRQPLGGHNSVYGGGSYDPEQLVDIVFVVGHQHRGGMGIHLFDDATGDCLCESRPRYGNEEGVVGNEKGYIVEMSACHFDPPLKRRLKDAMRVVALYNSTEAHTGVMSLVYIAIADSSEVGVDGREPSVQMTPLSASDNEVEFHSLVDAHALQQGMMPLMGVMLGAAMAVGAALGVVGTYVFTRVMTKATRSGHDETLYVGLPDQRMSISSARH